MKKWLHSPVLGVRKQLFDVRNVDYLLTPIHAAAGLKDREVIECTIW